MIDGAMPAVELRASAAKHYRAAVISAMTLLETNLRARLRRHSPSEGTQPRSLSAVIQAAIDQDLIPPINAGRINEWISARNEAVHTNRTISAQLAKSIVDGVDKVLEF